MLGATECLAADDVTIRCRVRHSEKASHRCLSEPQDMICTMRVWHKTTMPAASAVVKKIEISHSRSFDFSPHRKKLPKHGPELVLTSNQSPVMVHANSLGHFSEPLSTSRRLGSGNFNMARRSSSRQRTRNRECMDCTTVIKDFSVPVADIMVVDMFGSGDSHQCNITTMSHGFFELTMENRNGQDILMAFLNANLPKERVMSGMRKRTGSEISDDTKSTGTTSFDVEAFTATRMTERIQSETMSEKLRRKVVRVFSSFEELSAALTDCTCGCPQDQSQAVAQQNSEKRDSPPPLDSSQLEHAMDMTPEPVMRMRCSERDNSKRKLMLQDCNLPSGLSVEDEDIAEVHVQ